MNIFLYNNMTGELELNIPEILLVKEFKALMDNDRNKCSEDKIGNKKLRAFREFKYIYLAIDWESIYSEFEELERHQESLKDSSLTKEEFDDPIFREACRKYKKILESNRVIKLLKAAQNTVDKFTNYFNNIDPEERDVQTGKPIFKVKDIINEIANLDKVLEGLQSLEVQAKKHLEGKSSIRGGVVDGYTPNF